MNNGKEIKRWNIPIEEPIKCPNWPVRKKEDEPIPAPNWPVKTPIPVEKPGE